MDLQHEIEALEAPDTPNERDGLPYIVTCTPNWTLFRARCVEVLLAYIRGVRRFGSVDSRLLRASLPKWYREACAPDKTTEEAKTYIEWLRNLPYPARIEHAETPRPWTLKAWIYWMDPERREWHWVSSSGSENRGIVWIDARSHPFADGALVWLFRSAGAVEVDSEWEID